MEGIGQYTPSPNKRIDVDIPSDEVPGTTQRVVISMPLKRPLGDKDDSSPRAKRQGFQYVYLSLAAKKALCQYKRDNPKATQKDIRAYIEREFGVTKVPSSTLSSILANAEKYLSLDDSQATTGRLKLRAGNNQKMEEVLYSWYKKAMAEKMQITDAQIVAVARKIGERLKVPENFAYSYNWLSGFKIRMGIVSKPNVTGRKIKSKVVGAKRLSSSESPSTLASSAIGAIGTSPFTSDFHPNVKIEPPDEIGSITIPKVEVYSPASYDGDPTKVNIEFYDSYMNAAQDETEEGDFGLDVNCESEEAYDDSVYSLPDAPGSSNTQVLVPHPLGANATVNFPIVPSAISNMVRNTIENILPDTRTKTSVHTQKASFKSPQCKYNKRFTIRKMGVRNLVNIF